MWPVFVHFLKPLNEFTYECTTIPYQFTDYVLLFLCIQTMIGEYLDTIYTVFFF